MQVLTVFNDITVIIFQPHSVLKMAVEVIWGWRLCCQEICNLVHWRSWFVHCLLNKEKIRVEDMWLPWNKLGDSWGVQASNKSNAVQASNRLWLMWILFIFQVSSIYPSHRFLEILSISSCLLSYIKLYVDILECLTVLIYLKKTQALECLVWHPKLVKLFDPYLIL